MELQLITYTYIIIHELYFLNDGFVSDFALISRAGQVVLF